MPTWSSSYGLSRLCSAAGVRVEPVLREARDLEEGAEEGKGAAVGTFSRGGEAGDLSPLVSAAATTRGACLAKEMPCSIRRKSKDLVARVATGGIGLEGMGQSNVP